MLSSSVVEGGENKTEAKVSQYTVVYACIIIAVFFREHVNIAFLCLFCNVSTGIINVRQCPTSNRPVISCVIVASTPSEGNAVMKALQEANMSTEVGLVVLDILALYTQTFKVSPTA